MKTRFILLTVLFLLLIVLLDFFYVSDAYCQNIAKIRGFKAHFVLGGKTVDIAQLNSHFKNKGYARLSENYISFGSAGHIIIDKVIIGAEGINLRGSEKSSGNYKTSLSSNYMLGNIGYIIYSKNNLNYYPLIGFGYGRMRLRINEIEVNTFDEILDNPKRNVLLNTNSFLLNISLNTDYLLVLEKYGNEEFGLNFGLSVGYTLVPIEGDWWISGTEIINGPKVGNIGPYFRLMIGLGMKR